MIGQTISHYRILDKLGGGGMGVVYKAQDTHLDRTVALKFLATHLLDDEVHKARFLQEAKAAAALDHPNIATIHEIGEADSQAFLAMAFVDGPSLEKKIQQRPLKIDEALDIAIQIAQGLQSAHERGIIHRDIKSANILLTARGEVKITDFGLARFIDRTRLTASGVTMGTPAYMSPEQARGQAVDARSDIWSLGVVLYEMVTGRLPFAGDVEPAVIYSILNQEPEPPTALRSGVPRELDRITSKMLAKEPANRYQHVDDLLVDLRLVRRQLDASAPVAEGQAEKAQLRPKVVVRRIAVASGVVAVLAAVMAAAWYAGRKPAWENPLSGAKIERLTDFEGLEMDAAISRDGRSVAFLSDRDGTIDAWITRVGSGEFLNLTKGQVSGLLLPGIRSIGFSHDGGQIWLRVEQDPVGRVVPQGSWFVSIMGGRPRRFLENGVEPDWSPDGARLLYHDPAGGDPIFVADRNGANPKRIFSEEPGGHCHHLAWSTDGRFAYFTRGLPMERTDIWRIPAIGGEPERITHHNSVVGHPTLLSESMLLYTATSEDGSGPWLYAMDLRERLSRRVSVGVEQYSSLSGSDGGSRLVASVANPSSGLWTVPILNRLALEEDARKQTISAVRATGPRFGADYILYLASMGGAHGLWRLQHESATELWKATDGGLTGPPAISPDGSTVCFAVRKAGGGGLYLITPHGTNLRRLDTGDGLEFRGSASWSPDGKWLAVTAYQADRSRLFKIPVDGGAPVPLVDGRLTNPTWLADGSMILYRMRQGPSFTLKAVTPEGAPFTVPELITSATGVDGYRMVPGTRRMVALQGDVPNQNFWLVDLQTGSRRQLTDFKLSLRIRSFDVSPDGKQILFDRWREDSDLVLIERAAGKTPPRP